MSCRELQSSFWNAVFCSRLLLGPRKERARVEQKQFTKNFSFTHMGQGAVLHPAMGTIRCKTRTAATAGSELRNRRNPPEPRVCSCPLRRGVATPVADLRRVLTDRLLMLTQMQIQGCRWSGRRSNMYKDKNTTNANTKANTNTSTMQIQMQTQMQPISNTNSNSSRQTHKHKDKYN